MAYLYPVDRMHIKPLNQQYEGVIMALIMRLSIILLSSFFITKTAVAQWQAIRADFTGISRFKTVLPLTTSSLDLLLPYQIKDVECIAWTLYFESRGSTKEDQIAVAWVTMNRTSSEHFSSDLCTNIFQYGYKNGKKLYQFNWAAYKPSLSMKIETGPWLSIQDIAVAVYLRYIPDPTGGALYFKTRTSPDWAPNVTKQQIGEHVFW